MVQRGVPSSGSTPTTTPDFPLLTTTSVPSASVDELGVHLVAVEEVVGGDLVEPLSAPVARSRATTESV